MKYRCLVIMLLPFLLFYMAGCRQGGEKSGNMVQQSPEEVRSSIPVLSVSIHQAALEGQKGVVEKMLDEGADVNTPDEDGRTPLMYAAFNGHIEIIRLLLEKGATVNTCDSNGRTALMMASSGPYPAVVKILLDNKADPNIADKEERFTALMYASAEGQTDVVKLLLAFKADPSMKDTDGDDAMTFARNNGHNDIVSLLGLFTK